MKKIAINVLLVVIPAYLIIGILFLTDLISANELNATFIAASLNIVNFVTASYLFHKTLNRNNKRFLIFNLGGMGVRLFFLLCCIFILLKFLKIDFYAFILTFFVFYFVFLIMEVYYFHKSMQLAKRN